MTSLMATKCETTIRRSMLVKYGGIPCQIKQNPTIILFSFLNYSNSQRSVVVVVDDDDDVYAYTTNNNTNTNNNMIIYLTWF